MTKECVYSLAQDHPAQLIVVDNGSPIDFPSNIRLPVNRGYTGGVNAGIKHAKKSIICVANNDMIIPPGWVKALYDVFWAGYDVACLATTNAVDTGEGIQPANKVTDFWALPRKVQEQVGLLDERFDQGSFGDTDYAARIIQAGFKIGKNWDFWVTHFGSRTVEVTGTGAQEAQKLYMEKWGRVD